MGDVLIDRTGPGEKERNGNKETSHTLSDTQHTGRKRAR